MKKRFFVLFVPIITFLLLLFPTNALAATYLWPVPGVTYISQYYSNSHVGLDIAASGYHEIVAAREGTVIAAASTSCSHNGNKEFVHSTSSSTCNYGMGNYVQIKHSDGTYATYMHLRYGSVCVSKGQYVSRGDVIGIMGNSGNSTGQHLHFQVGYSSTNTINVNPSVIGYDYTTYSTPPSKPTITSCTASGSNISVSWNAVADATTYSVDFCKVVDGTYNHSYTSTSSTSLTKSLDDGWYAVRVEAGNSAGSSGFSGFYYLWVSNKTVPNSPQIKDITKDGNTVTVTWDGVDYANKYSVQFYNSDKDSRASYESAASSLTLELETARYGVRIFAVNSAGNSSANTSFTYFYLGNITVNLDACGGSVSENVTTIGYGDKYGQLPTPAKEGYKFKGWYTAASGGTQITNETVVTTSSTHTLYAQWEKAEDFIDTTVTLNNNSYTIDVDNNFSNGKIIVAGYNENALIQVTTFVADGTAKNQIWDNVTIDTVKVFIWESLNKLKPVMMQEITKDSFTKASEIWVLKSELPEGAEVIDTKYTYTLTSYAESAESQVDGWTLYDSEWKEFSASSFKYAAFPNGFDTNNSYYKTFKTSADAAYETETVKRTVSTSHSGYIYWHWCRNSYTSGPINRWVEDAYKSTSNGNFFTFHAFDSSTNVTESDGESCYKYSNENCCKDSYWYYKFPYYTCNTTDYTKVYKFKKTEDLESKTYPWNENASNIQEWACYIG